MIDIIDMIEEIDIVIEIEDQEVDLSLLENTINIPVKKIKEVDQVKKKKKINIKKERLLDLDLND